MVNALSIILFLDFDGVLHPIPTGDQGVFYHLERFEELLCSHPRLDVVVSSSWRLTYPWDEIKGFFADDLQERIIDKTPNIPGGSRYEEIQAWLKENSSHSEWLILDDQPDEFPPECTRLCLCETTVGFDAEAEKRLLGMLIETYRRIVG